MKIIFSQENPLQIVSEFSNLNQIFFLLLNYKCAKLKNLFVNRPSNPTIKHFHGKKHSKSRYLGDLFFKVRFLTQNKTQVKTIGPLLDMLRISLRVIYHTVFVGLIHIECLEAKHSIFSPTHFVHIMLVLQNPRCFKSKDIVPIKNHPVCRQDDRISQFNITFLSL